MTTNPFKRGKNTPESRFPYPPSLSEPCSPSAVGAWWFKGKWVKGPELSLTHDDHGLIHTIQVPKEILNQCDDGVKPRRHVEYLIVHALITVLLNRGYTLSLQRDGKFNVNASIKAMAEVFACDEETLYVHDKSHIIFGWVKLVYGNDGYDVISDHTTNLDDVMEIVDKFVAVYL